MALSSLKEMFAPSHPPGCHLPVVIERSFPFLRHMAPLSFVFTHGKMTVVLLEQNNTGESVNSGEAPPKSVMHPLQVPLLSKKELARNAADCNNEAWQGRWCNVSRMDKGCFEGAGLYFFTLGVL